LKILKNQTINIYEKSAVAVINKPTGMSSMTCVKRVQRIIGAKKAGHLGTLDPLASGVLVVALNKATKLFERHLGANKVYRAVFKFGVQTETFDSEGKIDKLEDVNITQQQVELAIKDFVGDFEQMPPAYSAKKINGKKAYELARAGQTVTLKTKKITISNFTYLSEIEKNTFLFEISCSSGTYVRSIARDLAKKLGTVGTMVGLVRLSSGEYNLSQAANLDDLTESDLIEVII
jgi:tRNA pseudouridine55 synthase